MPEALFIKLADFKGFYDFYQGNTEIPQNITFHGQFLLISGENSQDIKENGDESRPDINGRF